MKTAWATLLFAALLGSACNNNSTTTSPATTTTSPTTDVFTSIVAPLGTNSHTFTTSANGTITVTMTVAGPPSTIVMGLGLGILNPSGPGCILSTVVNTTAGTTPQITAPADAGQYCVTVSDIGNGPVTGVSFAVSIGHP